MGIRLKRRIIKKIVAIFAFVAAISAGGYIEDCIGLARIDYNQQLRDPTYSEMQEFLTCDKTDLNERKEGLFGLFFSYVCVNFARDVKRNAIKQGIRCAGVVVLFEDNKSNFEFHALIAFNTIDKGVIFIESQTDEEASLSPEDQYPYVILFHCIFWPKLKK